MLNKNIHLHYWCLLALIITSFVACQTNDDDGFGNAINNEDLREIATNIHTLIEASDELEILQENDNSYAYQYLNEQLNFLLNDPSVTHQDNFTWKIYILNNDSTSNAFATPGGYLYFDKGLLKTIETQAAFLHLLAHEIAYADLHLVDEKLVNSYGGNAILLDLAVDKSISEPQQLLDVLSQMPNPSSSVQTADDYMLHLACQKQVNPLNIIRFISIHTNTDWLYTHHINTISIEERLDSIRNYPCPDIDTTATAGEDPYIQFRNSL